MKINTRHKAIAWILSICLVITLIPELGFAATTDPTDPETTSIAPDEVTEENVVDKTETSTTYDLGKGEKMTVFHGGEVRYKDKDGKLVDYDPSLVEIKNGEKTEQNQSLSDYAYENKEGDKKHYLPETLSEDTPILLESGDYQAGFTMTDQTLEQMGAAKDAVSIKKETIPTTYEQEEKLPVNAVYGSATSDAKLTYSSGESGIKETLTLKEKPGSNVFTYKLILKGMKARKNTTNEGITCYDKKTGEITGSIDAPWMNDASGDAYSEAITFDLKQDSGSVDTYLLTMTLDESYLNAKDRQYPVTVDPSYTWQGSAEVKDAYIISGSTYANTNFYESGTKKMPAGKNSTGTHRTCIKFTDLTKILKNQSVTSAKLTAYETGTGASSQKVGIHRITENWSLGSVTWNKRPSISGTYDTITTKKTAHTAQVFNVLSFAKGLASGSITNYGLMLKNNTSTMSYACFTGSRATSYRPKLVCTYYSKPTTATSASISSSVAGSVTNGKHVYVKSSTDAKITYAGITSTGLNRVEYRVYKHNDVTGANTLYLDYSSARTIKSGGTLPSLPAGCYVLAVRGVNTAGTAGSQKTTTNYVHVDNTAPSWASATVTLTPASTEEHPGNTTTPTLEWKNLAEPHLKLVQYSVDQGAYATAGSAASGKIVIPASKFGYTGLHTIRLKATDWRGLVSDEKTISNYYVCIDVPKIGTLRVSDGTRSSLGETDWTSDANPTIHFSGLREEHVEIEPTGVTYALTPKDVAPTASDYKAAADLQLEGTAPVYQGSFKLNKSDQEKPEGAYDLSVRFTNTTGNRAEKTLAYNKDAQAPTGSITVTQNGSGSGITQLSDTVIMTGAISDGTDPVHTSGIKDSSLRVYQTGTEEKETAIVYKDTSISTTRAFDTTKYRNGSYILKLDIEDNAGNKKQVTKEVTIANPMAAPQLETVPASGNRYTLSWDWKEDVPLSGVEYKVGKDGTWTAVSGGATQQGSTELSLPETEGSYPVFVRGIDTAGISGNAAQIDCLVDQTDPTAGLDRFQQGILTGTAADAHLKSWIVEIKEKEAADTAYKQVLEGSKSVENGKLGFMDLSDPAYIAGHTYVLRLTVTDANGNEKTVTKEITRQPDTEVAQRIKAKMRVQRPEGQSYSTDRIRFGTQLEQMQLKTGEDFAPDAGNTAWYVDGNQVSKSLIYAADFTTQGTSSYQADQAYRVLAVSRDADGNRCYSRDIIQNGLAKEVSFLDVTPKQNVFTKEIQTDEKAVALRLMGDDKTASGAEINYEVKKKDGTFAQIEPGQHYETSQLDPGSIYQKTWTIRATVSGEAVTTIRNIKLVADTLEEETFVLSPVEDYRPVALSAKDKINYKTYLKWDTMQDSTEEAEMPSNISFEVYRSTQDGFTPDADTKVTNTGQDRYFTEINTNYAKGFYYRVCAVETDAEGTVLHRSSYSDQMYGRVLDADEYTKRMGIKEYWQYAEMSTPNGKASIEKSEGNLVYQQTDATLPNEKMEVSLERTYNSNSTAKAAFGVGWTHAYDMELLNMNQTDTAETKDLVLRYGDGSTYQFQKQAGSEEYLSSMGKEVILKETTSTEPEVVQLPLRGVGITTEDNQQEVTVDSAYIVTTKDNQEYRFNAGGQLVLMKEPNGNFLLFTYDPATGMLSKITTNRNLQMDFVYNEAKDGQDPLTVKEVRLPDGSSYAYTYAGNSSNENTKLVSVTHTGTDGAKIVYGYEYGQMDPKDPGSVKVTKILDAKGNPYTIGYNEDGSQAVSMSDPAGKQTSLTYSASGYETKTQTLTEGDVLTTEWDKFDGYFGNSMEHTDAAGNTTAYTYRDNLLETTTDTIEYETVDSQSKTVQSHETTRSDTTKRDDADNVTLEKSEGGERTTYSYLGKDAGEIKDDLVKEEKTINSDNVMTSEIEYEYDEEGNETNSYDTVTDEETETEYYGDDTDRSLAGEVKSETEKEKDTVVSNTTYTYEYLADGSKKETATEICDGVTTKTITVTDSMGRDLSTETVVNGATTQKVTNTYDGFGRLIRTVTTDGDLTTTTSSTYDANGTLVSQTDNDGTVTSYTYDTINRQTGRTVSKGGTSRTWTTAYAYLDTPVYGAGMERTVENAYVTMETDPSGYLSSKTCVDALGHTIMEKAGGLYTYTAYDKQGSAISTYQAGTQADGQDGILTLNLYDADGNQTHTAVNPQTSGGSYVLAGDCIVTETAYDGSGNQTQAIDAKGTKTEYSYDVENQLTEVRQPGSAVTKFAYEKGLTDGASKVTTTDANGNKKSTKTNARGLEDAITDYLDADTAGIERTYEYDGQGNKVKERELEGNYKTFAYDGKNRLTQTRSYDKSGTETLRIRYTYDTNDQVTLMQDYKVASGTETLYRSTKYSYDRLKRMTGYAEWNGTGDAPAQDTVSYVYGADDSLTEINYANSGSDVNGLIFEYTSDKWLSKIKAKKAGGGNALLREYSYDNHGKVTQMKDYRNFMSGNDYIQRNYTYDNFDRVTAMEYQDSSDLDAVKESYAYTYDKNSNITSERMTSAYIQDEEGNDLDRTREYTYDEKGQLVKTEETDNNVGETSKVTTEYTYDKVGNRTADTKGNVTTTYTYNGLDQLTASEKGSVKTSYDYDKNGNQIKETSGTTINTMDYDADNRLSKYEKKKNGAVVLNQENQYNGSGQRIQKKETKDGTSQTKNYYYQDGTVLYTTDGEEQLSGFNLMGQSGNIIATSRGANSSTNWYLYNKDVRESTSSLVDGSGAVSAAYVYDDFGNTEVKVGAEFDNEFGYTGQIWDQSTGLYYYNARFYDPENGRFVTQDTYRGENVEPDTLQLYGYCAGNPVNYVDPSGHDAIVLKSNFATRWIGHMAVIVQGKYFTWDPSEWRNEKINKNVSKFIKNRQIKNGKKFNKTVGRKSKSKVYRKYIYIKGDFSKSANYIATGNAKAAIRNYNLLTTNCAWMAIHVLRKKYSKGSSMYSALWHMQYSKIWTRAGRRIKRDTIVPNSCLKKLARLYGTRIKTITKPI